MGLIIFSFLLAAGTPQESASTGEAFKTLFVGRIVSYFLSFLVNITDLILQNCFSV